MAESVQGLVRRTENSYVYRNTRIGKYVYWSMHETIETIDAYLNSKHLTGLKDSLGREKPFFNIVTAAANIWFRATNIDRRDIQILPDASTETALAFVATVHLQIWMIREQFGMFLNHWGRTLARYGSAVVKFVKQNGRLIPSVVPWRQLIVDPIDFNALPTIEKFYLTPAQLRQNKLYDQKAVEGLIQAITVRRNLERQPLDYQSDFIELYEVHGELPTSLLDPEKGSDTEYRQQMHVVSFAMTKEGKDYDDFTLYRGREERSPYMITHLIEEPGRTLSIGAVEYLFDAQWMQNHTIKSQRDYLDLASKLIFQTSDAHFIGRNVLSAIETGDILIHSINQPLTQVNNTVQNITALEAFSKQWMVLTQDVTSTSDAMKGNTMPSGTPYALGALLQQQSGSLFEIMTEHKGMYLENMLREFIIPFLKTKMNTSEEIAAILDERGISEIDAMYVPSEAIRRYNKQAIDTVLKGPGNVPSPFMQMDMENQVKQSLAPWGNKRFIKPSSIKTKTWAAMLKDFQWTCRIQITNEMQDKQTLLTTLSTVLQSLATNPALLQDPNAKMLFGKILTLTGAVSPIELSPAQTPSPMQPVSGGIPNSGSSTGKLAQINR